MGHSEQGWASEGSVLLLFNECQTYKEGDIWMLSSIEKRRSEKVGLMCAIFDSGNIQPVVD